MQCLPSISSACTTSLVAHEHDGVVLLGRAKGGASQQMSSHSLMTTLLSYMPAGKALLFVAWTATTATWNGRPELTALTTHMPCSQPPAVTTSCSAPLGHSSLPDDSVRHPAAARVPAGVLGKGSHSAVPQNCTPSLNTTALPFVRMQLVAWYIFSRRIARNVRYGPGPRQHLDLYWPPGASRKVASSDSAKTPVVIYITGVRGKVFDASQRTKGQVKG